MFGLSPKKAVALPSGLLTLTRNPSGLLETIGHACRLADRSIWPLSKLEEFPFPLAKQEVRDAICEKYAFEDELASLRAEEQRIRDLPSCRNEAFKRLESGLTELQRSTRQNLTDRLMALASSSTIDERLSAGLKALLYTQPDTEKSGALSFGRREHNDGMNRAAVATLLSHVAISSLTADDLADWVSRQLPANGINDSDRTDKLGTIFERQKETHARLSELLSAKGRVIDGVDTWNLSLLTSIFFNAGALTPVDHCGRTLTDKAGLAGLEALQIKVGVSESLFRPDSNSRITRLDAEIWR